MRSLPLESVLVALVIGGILGTKTAFPSAGREKIDVNVDREQRPLRR
jgi:hypothetical protein